MSATDQELTGDINKLEMRRKHIQERLSGLYNLDHHNAHEELKRIQRSLGRLHLERDRLRRPEVYR